jgi:hypothetical protein
VYRDYAPKGVKFYYLYKALAHPTLDGYIAPYTLDERLMHVKEAQRVLGSDITWLCDTMSNDVKHALGDAPNAEFIIDPEGLIAARRVWSSPQALREDLERLVGPVEKPTTVDDLNMKRLYDEKPAASGVVPRLTLPGRMSAVLIEPQKADVPFYVKLRAEAEPALLRDGEGALYLGFFLDPLYRVHWNNLVTPVEYTIEAPVGVEVSPASGKGADPETEADIDPREFLVQVKREAGADTAEPLKVTVRYFACSDTEGWCIPVTQKYLVRLERDPDGGSRMDGMRRGGGGDRAGQRRGEGQGRGPGGGGRGAGGPGGMDPAAMFDRLDADGDGRLTKEELPEPMRDRILQRFDSNGDGIITREEMQGD